MNLCTHKLSNFQSFEFDIFPNIKYFNLSCIKFNSLFCVFLYIYQTFVQFFNSQASVFINVQFSKTSNLKFFICEFSSPKFFVCRISEFSNIYINSRSSKFPSRRVHEFSNLQYFLLRIALFSKFPNIPIIL